MTRWFSVLVSCAGLLGCAGGSETGNPAMPAEIGLGVRSSDPTAVAISSAAESTVIDEAWVSFGEIAFLAPSECALLDSYPHREATLIAADLALPALSIEVEVKPREYCGMVVTLENNTTDLSGEAPAELADHSIVLRGHRDDGVAFTLAFPEQDELELLATQTAFEVRQGRGLLLAFDVATWMRGVDLHAAELEPDSSIRIDEQTNRALLFVFEANLDCSLELFEDHNGSGALESGEPRIARCAPN